MSLISLSFPTCTLSLQDLKTELDFRHVAGFVTGDDGETPPIDVPGITKRLDPIKRMCKSDVPTDLVT